jgi:hypothetical protein
MIVSLPDIHEPNRCVVQRFIMQFYVGEEARFKEEGVGINSGPQKERAKYLGGRGR